VWTEEGSGTNPLYKVGHKIILVPYFKEHVETYHRWIQDKELRDLTATTDMTLEEAYQMQESWSHDGNKLIFIILDKTLPDTPGTGTHGGGMAGDVDLFFTNEATNEGSPDQVGEINVMIAEKECRSKGLAKEALYLIMNYAVIHHRVTQFVAKISFTNAPSINFFSKSLNFKEIHRSDAFQEVTYALNVTEEVQVMLRLQTQHVEYKEY